MQLGASSGSSLMLLRTAPMPLLLLLLLQPTRQWTYPTLLLWLHSKQHRRAQLLEQRGGIGMSRYTISVSLHSCYAAPGKSVAATLSESTRTVLRCVFYFVRRTLQVSTSGLGCLQEAQLQQKYDILKREKDTMQREHNGLLVKHDILQHDLDEVRKRLQDSESKLSELQAKAKLRRADPQQLIDKQSMIQHLRESEKHLQSRLSQMTDCENKLKERVAQVERLQQENNELREEKDACAKKLRESEADVYHLQQQGALHRQELAGTERRYQALEADNALFEKNGACCITSHVSCRINAAWRPWWGHCMD